MKELYAAPAFVNNVEGTLGLPLSGAQAACLRREYLKLSERDLSDALAAALRPAANPSAQTSSELISRVLEACGVTR